MSKLSNLEAIEGSKYQLGIDESDTPALKLDDSHYISWFRGYRFQISTITGSDAGASVTDLMQTVNIIRRIKEPQATTLLLFRHLYEAFSFYDLEPLSDQLAINAFVRETARQCSTGIEGFDIKLLPKYQYTKCPSESNVAVYFQATPSDKMEIVPSSYDVILRAYLSADAMQLIFNYDGDYYSYQLPEFMRNKDMNQDALLAIFIAYIELMMYNVYATYTLSTFNLMPTRNKPDQGNYKETIASIKCCKSLREFGKRILKVYTARLNGDMLEKEENQLDLFERLEEAQTGRVAPFPNIFYDELDSDNTTRGVSGNQSVKKRGRPAKSGKAAKTNLF